MQMFSPRRFLTNKAIILSMVFAFMFVMGATVVVSQAQEEEGSAAEGFWPEKPSPEMIKEGEKIYFVKCVWCHGTEGAGDGPGADRLWPRPRDFTQGTFKIRHTASGELPTDEDLFQTVTHGLPGSAMPGWSHVLTDSQRRAVVAFVMTDLVVDRGFWDEEYEEYTPIVVQNQIPTSEESIAKGREVYMRKAKCAECHGEDGRGNGNLTQKDEWGFKIVPANLTKCWNLRGNREDPYNPQNIFREVSTGLNGTPMPSFHDELSEEDRWHVSNFVISLCDEYGIDPITRKPKLGFVIRSNYVEGELPGSVDDPAWEEFGSVYVGMGAQITHKPRNFVRKLDDIRVTSLYNDDEIVYLLEWSDRTESHITDEGEKALKEGIREVPPSGQPVAKLGITKWPIFNDSIAIQFPAHWQDLSAPEKPRFIFGDKKNAVDLWKWESSGEVKEYTGNGWNKLNFRDNKGVSVPGAVWKDGQWRVIMKRSRTTDDLENEVQFELGKYVPTVFFAWEGNNGDAGRKMSLSTWWYTILIPPVPMKVYVIPPIVALVLIGAQFWFKSKAEKLHRS